MYISQYLERESSVIDWCEDNYVYSNTIAEFYNTLSSLALVVYPVIMILLSHRYTRFYTSKSYGSWIILLIIGVSSVYYHATLSLVGQLLDEIAILWVQVYTLGIWFPRRFYSKYLERSSFQLICLLVGITTTILGTLAPLMNAFFLTAIGPPYAYIVVNEVCRLNIPELNKLTLRTGCIWVIGVAVWALDRAACGFWQSISFPHLHSIWHVCIAVAGHQVCIIAMYFHSIYEWKDLHTELAYWPESFPRLLSVPYVKMAPIAINNNSNKQSETYVINNGYSPLKNGNMRKVH